MSSMTMATMTMTACIIEFVSVARIMGHAKKNPVLLKTSLAICDEVVHIIFLLACFFMSHVIWCAFEIYRLSRSAFYICVKTVLCALALVV